MRYIGGIVAVVNHGTVNMENILFTGTIDVVETDSTKRTYAGGIIGVTTGHTNEATTVNLNSCISAGKINWHTSMVGAIIGRAEYAYVETGEGEEKEVIAADTYLNMTNVFATRECHNCISYDVVKKVDAETNEVIAQGIMNGYVVQPQYNSDRLIGYCSEKDSSDSGAQLDFTSDNPTWVIRTDGVPVPSAFADMVSVVEIPDDSTLDATLTSESGLDYWETELTLQDAVHVGQGNYLLNYTEMDELTYEGFLDYLTNEGFKEQVTNSGSTMYDDGIHNVTYIKDNWVLHITHIDNMGTVDVSVNTFGKEASLLSQNLDSRNVEQTKGGSAVKLSMLEIKKETSANESNIYGNSFVFQLPNGHFIISDGGNKADADNLLTYLKEAVGKDENGEQKPVYIDAWIISHFHEDHCGALMKLRESNKDSLRKDVYLNAVYVNEPNNYAKLVDDENQIDMLNIALAGVMRFTKSPDTIDRPDVYRMHTGERYYFDGLIMDVVLAQEQIQPMITLESNVSIPTASVGLPYRYYGDRDGFNATSTSCVFTVNSTSDKVYIGGDSNRANMNYIMKAYDGLNAFVYMTKDSSTSYTCWTEKINGTISQTQSKTLSDITVFTALHHGKNTSNGFTQYLFGTTASTDDSLKIVLFPWHQMYSATYKASAVGSDGVTYTNRYWMEDGSTVFDYKIEEYNQNLCASADNEYYTYGYEDGISAIVDNRHGTVELTFTTDGINANILKTWHEGFKMETFQ